MTDSQRRPGFAIGIILFLSLVILSPLILAGLVLSWILDPNH